MSALATADFSSRAVGSTVSASIRRAWFYPALCCAALLVSILIANPFNTAGFNDDWSYARVAMKLAQTGKMQYNGWGSPILLFQSFWALPWIRAFGFSFPVLKASMIPVSAGFVLLVYATGLRVGLSRELAAFASIATATSPLFLPLAASFMTDAPGCFFSMLCIYAAIRSAQAGQTRETTRWLWALALAGVIGGANRQVVWIAPIMLIPYLFWLRRADKQFRVQAIAAYAASGLAILTITHFLSQPYGPLQLTHDELAFILRHEWGRASNLMASLLLTCILTALPAYCCLTPIARRAPAIWWLLAVPVLVILTFAMVIFTGLVAPFGNCILSWTGIVTEGQEWFGSKPASLPPAVRMLLSGIAVLCVTVTIGWLARKPWNNVNFSIFALFTLGYMALTVPGVMLGFAFDRYMLPILPLVMLVILTQAAKFRPTVPAAAWVCVIAFACYGIATTHDYSAALRARIAVAERLQQSGIGRDHVSAGFEYDGWTELERSEYASVVQYKDLFADDHAKGFWFWFWNHTPNLHPDYVVMNWTSPEPVRGVVGPKVDFQAWLPPHRRSAVAWKRADLSNAFQAARIATSLR